MEVATGNGNFSWMIPFAIEGDFVLYLNDIGGKALNACMQNLRMMYEKLGVYDLLESVNIIRTVVI